MDRRLTPGQLLAIRAICICSVAVASVATLSRRADASLWLRMTPPSGVSGDAIEVRTIGDGAVRLAAGSTLALSLVPEGEGGSGVTVGWLDVDDRGNASGRFVVPDTEAGTYSVVVECAVCASTSGGRSRLVAGTFRVSRPSISGERPSLGAALTAGTVLLSLLVGAYAYRVTRARHRASTASVERP